MAPAVLGLVEKLPCQISLVALVAIAMIWILDVASFNFLGEKVTSHDPTWRKVSRCLLKQKVAKMSLWVAHLLYSNVQYTVHQFSFHQLKKTNMFAE